MTTPTNRPSVAELLARARPLVLPGVYDALSAKFAEREGFAAVFVSGYSLSAASLGEPDFGFVAHADVMDAAERVLAAVRVPVLVDIDTGYGNAFNAERAVATLVRRGAAGCFLEDQIWPKRCGHMEQKRVVPLDDYLPKLRAAIAARGDAPFHVTARTDARAVHGLDEAIRRARAFADAGADAVFVEAPQSIEEMRAVRSALPAHVTLVANMVEHGKTPVRSAAALGADGYDLVVVPIAGLLAAAHALRGVFRALAADGTSSAYQDRMLTFDELNAVTGLPERYAREKAFLRDED